MFSSAGGPGIGGGPETAVLGVVLLVIVVAVVIWKGFF
jgi:hypothetical protein